MKDKWANLAGNYLTQTLGLEVHFDEAPERAQWPLNLREAYDACRCRVFSGEFLALHARGAKHTPGILAKHADWILRRTGLRSLFIFDSIALHQRRRLIAARLPFLCPGNQLYLPDLGLDLRERVKAPPPGTSRLTPAAQVLVLACLHKKLEAGTHWTGVELGAKFGYSKMTMARALEELRQRAWIETEGSRRTSRHRFTIGGRALWEQARAQLSSPVRKRIYLGERMEGIAFNAGEAALAKQTHLGEPTRPVWAMTLAQLNALKQNNRTHAPETDKETAEAEIEVWGYDPALLGRPPLVDELSLVLSLQENTDERIQMAIDEVLERFPW